jgi:hypothetical protein
MSETTQAQTVRVHELKTFPEYFASVLDGSKPFEVRNDDRGFAVGDALHLREYETTSGYTGREIRKRVCYVLRGYPELKDGFVVLGLWSGSDARRELEALKNEIDTQPSWEIDHVSYYIDARLARLPEK